MKRKHSEAKDDKILLYTIRQPIVRNKVGNFLEYEIFSLEEKTFVENTFVKTFFFPKVISELIVSFLLKEKSFFFTEKDTLVKINYVNDTKDLLLKHYDGDWVSTWPCFCVKNEKKIIFFENLNQVAADFVFTDISHTFVVPGCICSGYNNCCSFFFHVHRNWFYDTVVVEGWKLVNNSFEKLFCTLSSPGTFWALGPYIFNQTTSILYDQNGIEKKIDDEPYLCLSYASFIFFVSFFHLEIMEVRTNHHERFSIEHLISVKKIYLSERYGGAFIMSSVCSPALKDILIVLVRNTHLHFLNPETGKKFKKRIDDDLCYHLYCKNQFLLIPRFHDNKVSDFLYIYKENSLEFVSQLNVSKKLIDIVENNGKILLLLKSDM